MESSAAVGFMGSVAGVNKALAKLSYIILCFRGYFSGIIEDTIIVTLLLNLLIACSIDYSKVRKPFFVFAFLSLLTVYNKNALALVDILALIYILRHVDIRFVIKANLITIGVYLVIWLGLLGLGILHDRLMIMPKGIAHCMGYENPNQFGMLGFQIISSLFLILSGKKRLLMFILIPVINEFFFSLSVARTPWIGGYVMMLVMLLSVLRILRPWTRYFVAVIPILIYIGIFYFAKHINEYPELDIIFTTRFSNYAMLINNMSPINWIIGFRQTKDIIIDSSYLMILCSGGFLTLFVFWNKFIKTILTKWNKIYQSLPFLLAMLANGVGENAFSSAGGLSLIFWYIIFSPLDQHKKAI